MVWETAWDTDTVLSLVTSEPGRELLRFRDDLEEVKEHIRAIPEGVINIAANDLDSIRASLESAALKNLFDAANHYSQIVDKAIVQARSNLSVAEMHLDDMLNRIDQAAAAIAPRGCTEPVHLGPYYDVMEAAAERDRLIRECISKGGRPSYYVSRFQDTDPRTGQIRYGYNVSGECCFTSDGGVQPPEPRPPSPPQPPQPSPQPEPPSPQPSPQPSPPSPQPSPQPSPPYPQPSPQPVPPYPQPSPQPAPTEPGECPKCPDLGKFCARAPVIPGATMIYETTVGDLGEISSRLSEYQRQYPDDYVWFLTCPTSVSMGDYCKFKAWIYRMPRSGAGVGDGGSCPELSSGNVDEGLRAEYRVYSLPNKPEKPCWDIYPVGGDEWRYMYEFERNRDELMKLAEKIMSSNIE